MKPEKPRDHQVPTSQPPPSPRRRSMKFLVQSQAPGWIPALTRVNIIPSVEVKQEVKTTGHLTVAGNQKLFPLPEFCRNSLPSLTFPVQLLARFCFAWVIEISPKTLGPARGKRKVTSAGGWRRRCLPAPGAWLEPVGGALGSLSSESRASRWTVSQCCVLEAQ